MKKLVLTAAGAILLSNSVFAGEYRTELGVNYGQIDIELPDFDVSLSESDYLQVQGIFYLNPVDDTMGPLKEASFQNKSSFVNLSHTSFDVEYSGAPSEDGTLSRIQGRYVVNSKWILQAATGDGFIDDRVFIPYNDTAHLIGAGAYINDDMSLVFNFEKLEASKVLGASFHALHAIGSRFSIAYDFDAQYIDVDDGDSSNYLAGGVDFYLTPQLNLGAKLGIINSDETDSIRSEVHAGYFVSDSIELSALYAVTDIEGDGAEDLETDQLAVQVSVRF